MEFHLERLQSLCRVCTNKLGRVSYACNTSTLIQEVFEWDKTNHNPAIHPPRYCNSCYLTMHRMKKAVKEGTVHRTSLTLHTWTEYQDEACGTCDMVVGRTTGGRPKKQKNILQCPSNLIKHLGSMS